MLRWSIATVCMGGALEAKLARGSQGGLSGGRDLRERPDLLQRQAARCARDGRRSRPRDRRAAADARFRGDAGSDPRAQFRARRAQVRTDARARRAAAVPLLQRLGGSDRRSRARRRGPRRARGPRAPATVSPSATRRLAWGRHVRDWTAAWDIVRAADRPNLGIVLDSFHACVRGNPIAPMSAIPAEKIALVQVADAPALQMDPLSLSRHYRCYPGQGDYPIVDYLEAIAGTPAIAARFRWRSSTISSAAPRPMRSRSTACGRCARWARR